MKKFTLIAVAFLFSMATSLTLDAQSTTPRYGGAKNQCNNGGCLTYKAVSVTTTSATAVLYQAPNAYETLVKIGTLKHALTDSVKVTDAHLGDKLIYIFNADTLTAGRVVTFGNGFYSAGTLTVPNSKSSHSGQASITFIFDGAKFTEECRALNSN